MYVTEGFADSFTPSFYILIGKKTVFPSKIKSAMDRRCFAIRGIGDYEQELQLLSYYIWWFEWKCEKQQRCSQPLLTSATFLYVLRCFRQKQNRIIFMFLFCTILINPVVFQGIIVRSAMNLLNEFARAPSLVSK